MSVTTINDGQARQPLALYNTDALRGARELLRMRDSLKDVPRAKFALAAAELCLHSLAEEGLVPVELDMES